MNTFETPLIQPNRKTNAPMRTIDQDSPQQSGIQPCASPAWTRIRTFSVSLAAAVSLLFATQGRAVDAALDVGDFGIDTTTRTLPAVLNKAVDLGAFTFNGSTGSLVISVNAIGGSYSVAKRFVIPMRYNLLGISAANTWLKVLPTHDTGAFSGNDFDLDIKGSLGVMNVRLRVAATDGVHPTAANIVVESTGVSAIAYSTASAVVVPPTAAQVYGGNVLTQIAGRVGVNTLPSADAALDINGGDTKGFRIRPRTVTGSPTTGAWNIGTLIVDSAGNLFVCTADGTPGTWKKVTP